ncbi:MAG: tRNA(adenine34) deaminase [Pseudohongiellaceae bacterium]
MINMSPIAESVPDLKAHERWMVLALAEAERARQLDEVPVGAVVVYRGKLVGVGCNRPITSNDPTSHAEIQAIRQACDSEQNYRLPGTTMYVTIEPCVMCVGAMVHARIDTVVFGAREPKAGALVSQMTLGQAPHFNHELQVIEGVLVEDCRSIMQTFFKSKRSKA